VPELGVAVLPLEVEESVEPPAGPELLGAATPAPELDPLLPDMPLEEPLLPDMPLDDPLLPDMPLEELLGEVADAPEEPEELPMPDILPVPHAASTSAHARGMVHFNIKVLLKNR